MKETMKYRKPEKARRGEREQKGKGAAIFPFSFPAFPVRPPAHFLSCCCLASLAVLPTPDLHGQGAIAGGGTTGRDLTEISLDELVNLKVTSVSKKPEKLSHAPAAIAVITGEDMRRSGVTTIAEALRLAPGLEVARVDSISWAISSRGFNDVFANKLLVLMDGRSVYTPLFSGVYWDVQDTMLEDIDRIEVIRGPGAALWGANAVNGVINITTKAAKETQGGLVTAGGGTEERGFTSVRYGGQINDKAWYRVYAKYFNRDDSATPSGADAGDDWDQFRTGFRADWEHSPPNLFTLQGDLYAGTEHQNYILPTLSTPPTYSSLQPQKIRVAGGNLVGRWTHTFHEEADLRFQVYYDRTERELEIFSEDRDTFDLDLQIHHPFGEFQEFVWGIGYRHTDSHNFKSNFNLSFVPADRKTDEYSAFVQDEISLIPDRLRLTLGSKFEHNEYTGSEIQPSGRLLWTPHARHSAWASVSRAVRTPSRADIDLRLVNSVIPPGTPPLLLPAPGVVTLVGNPDKQSEVLLAYEAGYRVVIHDRLTLDTAFFYNDYDRLTTFEPAGQDLSTLPGSIGLPQAFSNLAEGETYGGELAANIQLNEWWRLRPSYSFLQVQLHRKRNSQDPTAEDAEGDSPQHQVSLRSEMDLPWHLQLDCVARYVDSLPNRNIPSYAELDVRIGWRPSNQFEISIVGQNLLDSQHPEFQQLILGPPQAELERGVYGRITFRF
jgi:iron complex outermembrane receptor protein